MLIKTLYCYNFHLIPNVYFVFLCRLSRVPRVFHFPRKKWFSSPWFALKRKFQTIKFFVPGALFHIYSRSLCTFLPNALTHIHTPPQHTFSKFHWKYHFYQEPLETFYYGLQKFYLQFNWIKKERKEIHLNYVRGGKTCRWKTQSNENIRKRTNNNNNNNRQITTVNNAITPLTKNCFIFLRFWVLLSQCSLSCYTFKLIVRKCTSVFARLFMFLCMLRCISIWRAVCS